MSRDARKKWKLIPKQIEGMKYSIEINDKEKIQATEKNQQSQK